MKAIKPSELKKGDIFTKEIKLHGREAFLVESNPDGKGFVHVVSRNTGDKKKLNVKNVKYVMLLCRTDKEKP